VSDEAPIVPTVPTVPIVGDDYKATYSPTRDAYIVVHIPTGRSVDIPARGVELRTPDRALDTVRAVSFGLDQMRLAVRKDRAPHISGPEPQGTGSFLSIPAVITPEVDRHIRDWLAKNKQERETPNETS